MSIAASIDKAETQRYRVTGIDCPSCARKIEKAVRSVGVKNVKVSTATQIMTLRVDDLEATPFQQDLHTGQRVEGQVFVIQRIPLDHFQKISRIHEL